MTEIPPRDDASFRIGSIPNDTDILLNVGGVEHNRNAMFIVPPEAFTITVYLGAENVAKRIAIEVFPADKPAAVPGGPNDGILLPVVCVRDSDSVIIKLQIAVCVYYLEIDSAVMITRIRPDKCHLRDIITLITTLTTTEPFNVPTLP